MSKPDMTPISRFPDLEKPGRERLNQLLRLFILTTRGDILTRGATYLKRLALGTAGQILRSDGTDIAWESPGIADNKVLEVDATAGAPADDEYARFTASGIEGRTVAEVKSDLAIDHGADLAGLGDDDHAQYVKDTEFTAAEDILVGTGSGTFVKKTPAQLLAILSGDAGAAFDWNDKILQKVKGLLLTTATELTMDTNGAITVTQMVHTVDTFEDAVSDDLVTINGGTTVGFVVICPAHTDRTVVVKDGDGNIELLGGADITLDDITDHVMLFWDTTNSKWVDIGGGGGGGLVADSVESTHIDPTAAWGVSSKKLVNFVPYLSDYYVLDASNLGDSEFSAKINGSPSGTDLVYDTITGNENSIVTGNVGALGKLVLHNITRGDSALISQTVVGTNTITLTATVPVAWADNDDIQVNSLTALKPSTPFYYDLDCSGFLPATAVAIALDVSFGDSGAVNQSGRLHPYEIIGSAWFSKSFVLRNPTASAYTSYRWGVMPVTSQKICVLWDVSGAATGIMALRCFGWWEEAAT